MDENLPPAEGASTGSVPPAQPTQPAQPPLETPVSSAPTVPPLSTPPPIAPVHSSIPPLSSPPLSSAPPPPPRPPYNFPPPPIAPMSPAPRKGGRGWKILAILLFLALGVSLLGNLKSVARRVSSSSSSSVRHKRDYMEEIKIEDNGSGNKIAVIEVDGVITSSDMDRRGHNMVEQIRKELEAASKDSRVKAVVLKVNSPGGEVLASDEIYHAIDDFQQDSRKPVIASMQTLAASGGYYVSAPCRWIVANELTITGSIGVIMHGYNYRGLMDKIGIRPDVYKSGKFKNMLSGDRKEEEIPAEEKEMVQNLIMETYSKFTNIVETGRSEAYKANSKLKEKGQPLDDNWAEFADGRVLSGSQARDLGFVDELGDFQMAVERAQKLAGISNADLIQYQQPFDFGDLFGMFGKSESRTMKIDLGVETPKLQPGCMYFMYRQALP